MLFGQYQMSAGITPENEQFLREQVAAGLYSDREEALNAGVDLLKARQGLIARLARSREELDSGQYEEFDEEGLKTFFDELRVPLPPEIQ